MTKIFFAGHTGVRKEAVLKALASEIERHYPQYTNLVKVYPLEEYIKRASGEDPKQFPGMPSLGRMRAAWEKGWEELTRTITCENPKGCSLVSAHLVFYRFARFAAPARLDLIADWQPDAVVTLIDDSFAVRGRTTEKEYNFTLRELYTWRMAEWVMADQLAWMAGKARHARVTSQRPPKHIPNFLSSVKQPVHMLFRLLFQEDKFRRVYASFPITQTRNTQEMKEQINGFRRRLHRLFIVFDPLTIDERIMETWAAEAKAAERPRDRVRIDFKIGPAHRWDCRVNAASDAGNYAPLLWDDDIEKPIEIPVSEIEELRERRLEEESDIDEQITSRDYRLVDQAEAVICYQPYYLGRAHGGVDAEIGHANTSTTPVYAFSSYPKPHGPLKGKIDFIYPEEADFWTAIERLSQTPPDLPLREGRRWF